MAYTGQIRANVQSDDGMIHMFDNNASGQPIYEGIAEPGTATTSELWRILKFTYDSKGGVTSILMADGNKDFDNAWSGRASKTYS